MAPVRHGASEGTVVTKWNNFGDLFLYFWPAGTRTEVPKWLNSSTNRKQFNKLLLFGSFL
jgi:hypothetical protein